MSHPLQGYAGAGLLHPLQQFGPYQIERKLGEGAVSVVYSARGQDGQQVALKVLSPAAASQPRIRTLFRQEYQILSRLRYPGIVPVYEYGEQQGRPYIAMALIKGQTLEDFLTTHKTIGEMAALTIAQQVATTLDFIHAQGIVHRDLKPANILIDQERRALLFDFGAALDRQMSTQEDEGIYGTPSFLSPEQIRNDAAIDGRADLYALGIILYRMVSGRRPFYGSRQEILDAHLQESPTKPSKFGYVSAATEAVILKAIAKDPAHRFQTGAEFVTALEEAKLSAPPLETSSFPQRLLHWFRGAPDSAEDK
ncbi:MAG: serine/threonine protein kinase [Caldilineaceae bacterium]|nr:serine/threonine protein kinase [Caldilineaceae bacterium]